jgi:hypothetical protein
MKTAKLIIGIISIVLFFIIAFQSCAVGVVNAIDNNTQDASGGGGIFLAVLVLIAGIIGIASRNSKGGGICAGVFYVVAALIGFVSLGTFGDLIIWSVLSLVFGILFIAGSITMKPRPPKDAPTS